MPHPEQTDKIKTAPADAVDGWRPQSEAPNFTTFLVQHQDDLYPVTAYKMSDGIWYYEQDGAEDVFEPGDFKHSPLKHQPTHYMDLPGGPLSDNAPR